MSAGILKTLKIFLWLLLAGMALFIVAIIYIAVVDEPGIGYSLLRASFAYAGLLAFGLFVTLLWKFTGAIDTWREETSSQEFHDDVNEKVRDWRSYARKIFRRFM